MPHQKEYKALLCDIRSSHNVGSMFRTADAAGITTLYLAGTTPRPTDSFNRINKEIAKTALGAEKNVSWEYHKHTIRLLKQLQKEGHYIIAIEQSSTAIDYKKIKTPKKNVVFVVGNEVTGLPKKVLAECDVVAEIGMKGQKESLNVSVAFGIAVFGITRV